MKRIWWLILASSILIIFSCNNVEDNKTADNEEAANGPDVIPDASFKIIILRHPVRDFAAWKTEYLAQDSMRQFFGFNHFLFGRDLDDSNMVMVIDKITDGEKAKIFTRVPEWRMTMLKAGVTGPPAIALADVVRNDDAKIEQKERLMVIHKVKDFNAWLNVYDGEGMKARKKYGLIDR